MPRVISTDEWVRQATTVHGDKYGYSKVDYINNKKRIIIICPIHGEQLILPTSHLSGCGCHACYLKARKFNLTKFLVQCKRLHAMDCDYSKVVIVSFDAKVEIACPIHGSFFRTPRAHIKAANECPKCDHLLTIATKQVKDNAMHIASMWKARQAHV